MNKDFFIGYDEFLRVKSSATPSTYPPYNLIHQLDGDETNYRLEFAVAGFTLDQLDVTLANNSLVVASKETEVSQEKNETYLHRGIGKRQFKNSFKLSPDVEVVDSQLENGILTINLKKVVPEHLKPRKISINSVSSADTEKTLLTE